MTALLLDAGPLVAYIMFALKPGSAGQQRYVEKYNAVMEGKLVELVMSATRHVSLPNVLTEASNHLGSGKQEAHRGAAALLGNYVLTLDEVYKPSAKVVRFPEYCWLGLADSAILSCQDELKRDRGTVVTQDKELASALYAANVDCVNVMHWRTPGYV